MAFFKKSATAPDAGALPGRDSKATDWKAELRSITLIILTIMGFKSLVYSNHDIPSESMLPGLLTGDYIGVSRFAYGFSRYSVPLIPLPNSLKGRIFYTKPTQGDVVVFRYPGDDSLIYIKRLIGMPGDTIEMRNGQLFLNGKVVPKEKIGVLDRKIEPNYDCTGGPDDKMRAYRGADGACNVPLYRETLPNGKSYLVFDLLPNSLGDSFGPAIVPSGHYFMMGDNRDNSTDSRFPVIPGTTEGGVGFLDEDNLVGRADFIYLSTNGSGPWYKPWLWFHTFRTERIFSKVK
jgi:signal peptidase I